MRPQLTAVDVPTNPRVQLSKTVALIGQGIRAGAEYQPLRMHAAKVATTAPGRKDYLGQVGALYKDFMNRWRYVRDPVGIETVATSGPALWGVVYGNYNPGGKGWGDCDDATAALGAALMSIGFPVRIVTMSKPGTRIQSHVYPETQIPGLGWIPIDPVAHPLPMGGAPPAGVRIRWDLNGKKLGAQMSGYDEYTSTMGEGGAYPGAYVEPPIGLADIYQPAYAVPLSFAGLAGSGDQGYETADLEMCGLAGTDGEMPEDLIEGCGIGAYAEPFGVMGGGDIIAEVDPGPDGYAVTPLLEVGLMDYSYMQNERTPYVGMGATDAITGDYYRYQQDPVSGLGFFKKIFRRVRKRVKKVFRRIGKGVKRFIKKLPGGKYLLRFGRKLKKIAMKMVKPLVKLVGKAAPFLAKVAAFIPGYGPAIAAGLHTAGKIAKVMNKLGVKKKKGKLSFKSGQQMKAFKAEMKREAARAAGKKGKRKRRGVRGVDGPPRLRPRLRRRIRRMRRKLRRMRQADRARPRV